MAFVPGCDNDIFISYTHLDNEPFEGVELGWVSTFFHNLEKRLRMKLGKREVSLWMDHHDLVGNKPLTPQIKQALERTATFLVLVSPSYLNSEWCRKERAEFLHLIKERTSSDSRIFLVELDRVERNKFPPEFGELIPYSFWALEKETSIPRTLGWPTPMPSERDYYGQLNRLCVELADELTRLKVEAEAEQRHEVLSTQPPPMAHPYLLTQTNPQSF
jgi:hypothetical protein